MRSYIEPETRIWIYRTQTATSNKKSEAYRRNFLVRDRLGSIEAFGVELLEEACLAAVGVQRADCSVALTPFEGVEVEEAAECAFCWCLVSAGGSRRVHSSRLKRSRGAYAASSARRNASHSASLAMPAVRSSGCAEGLVAAPAAADAEAEAGPASASGPSVDAPADAAEGSSEKWAAAAVETTACVCVEAAKSSWSVGANEGGTWEARLCRVERCAPCPPFSSNRCRLFRLRNRSSQPAHREICISVHRYKLRKLNSKT